VRYLTAVERKIAPISDLTVYLIGGLSVTISVGSILILWYL
jgi:hypothetical protein